MKWPIVDKSKSSQPKTGNYRDAAWRELIAHECSNQCVYCAIHESNFGGIRNFHIDHFRPRKLFTKLENDIKNLFYSCCICNVFKGDDWPGEPNKKMSNIAYCDPGKNNFNKIFFVSDKSIVKSKYLSCKYMIEKLYLNRPQLIILRSYIKAKKQIEIEIKHLSELFFKLNKLTDRRSREFIQLIYNKTRSFSNLKDRYSEERPYSAEDARR